MAHSFIELDKAVAHVSVWLVFSVYGFQFVCPLMNKDKRLPDGRDWLRGKLRLVLRFLFDLSPIYGGGNEDNGKNKIFVINFNI